MTFNLGWGRPPFSSFFFFDMCVCVHMAFWYLQVGEFVRGFLNCFFFFFFLVWKGGGVVGWVIAWWGILFLFSGGGGWNGFLGGLRWGGFFLFFLFIFFFFFCWSERGVKWWDGSCHGANTL